MAHWNEAIQIRIPSARQVVQMSPQRPCPKKIGNPAIRRARFSVTLFVFRCRACCTGSYWLDHHWCCGRRQRKVCRRGTCWVVLGVIWLHLLTSSIHMVVRPCPWHRRCLCGRRQGKWYISVQNAYGSASGSFIRSHRGCCFCFLDDVFDAHDHHTSGNKVLPSVLVDLCLYVRTVHDYLGWSRWRLCDGVTPFVCQ